MNNYVNILLKHFFKILMECENSSSLLESSAKESDWLLQSAKKCKHRNNGDLTWVPTLTFFVGLTGHLCPPTVSVMAVKRAVVPLKTFKDIVSPMKLLRPIYMGENELDANVRVEFSTVMANDALTSIFVPYMKISNEEYKHFGNLGKEL